MEINHKSRILNYIEDFRYNLLNNTYKFSKEENDLLVGHLERFKNTLNSDLDKLEFDKLSFKLFPHYLDFGSIDSDKQENFYKKFSEVLLKDYSFNDKIKFLSTCSNDFALDGVDLLLDNRLLKAFNLPSLDIKFDKPLLLDIAKYNHDKDKYELKKVIATGINESQITLNKSFTQINLSKVSIEGRKEIFNKLEKVAKDKNIEIDDLPIMKFLDKYCIGGNPFYNLSFILQNELSDQDLNEVKTGQEYLLLDTKTQIRRLNDIDDDLDPIYFAEIQNRIDVLFNAMNDKTKRILLDDIIENINSKIYNKDILDLVLTEDLVKKIDRRIEIKNDQDMSNSNISKKDKEPDLM